MEMEEGWEEGWEWAQTVLVVQVRVHVGGSVVDVTAANGIGKSGEGTELLWCWNQYQ